MEEKFVVVSLSENKLKDIAKILSNDSSRKILDLLSEGRKTISEIAEKLEMPMPTVQYNVELLIVAGLIKKSAFKYSEKGRKIVYYEPEKKLIILAPKGEEKSVFDKIKLFTLPILFATGALISGIYAKMAYVPRTLLSESITQNTFLLENVPVSNAVVDTAITYVPEAGATVSNAVSAPAAMTAPIMDKSAETAYVLLNNTSSSVTTSSIISFIPNPWLLFLTGVMIGLTAMALFYAIWKLVKK